MWLKLLLAALSIAFCTLIGHVAAEKYRARKRFFSAMHSFNEKYLSELRYARKPLPTFLKENDFRGEFAALLQKFAAEHAVEPRQSFLSPDEKAFVGQYFGMLGRSDAQTQRGYFEAQQKPLGAMQAGAEKEAKERGELYLKLGLLSGLALVILIM